MSAGLIAKPIMLQGIAYRCKLMPDGNRQIVATPVSGDVRDLHAAILGEMDHSIVTITAGTSTTSP